MDLQLIRVVALWLPVALAGFASPAASGPMDLHEQRSRPVWVALEISPRHLPASLDHHYSERRPAWFEPGPGEGRVTIRVPGAEMERLLASFDPVPGSFDDYVWIFDVESGHVLSASVEGALLQNLDWGMIRTHVQAQIAAHMTTLRAAGFLPPRSRFGQLLFEHCGSRSPDCNLVAPRPYDPDTGYVNAVGSIEARAMGGITTQTFSPLGEAVFSEMRTDTAVSAR